MLIKITEDMLPQTLKHEEDEITQAGMIGKGCREEVELETSVEFKCNLNPRVSVERWLEVRLKGR